MSNIVLSAHDIYFDYAQKGMAPLAILKGVDLTLHEGETVAIVGSSGSGKSTFMHLLGGLDTPKSGEITLCGHHFSSASDNERTQLRNQYLGFVYQFHHLLAEFSALENVALPLRIRGVSKKIAHEEARLMLSAVGLEERMHHKPSEMSGGERQRAAIARALIHRPHCLLADEPTGNLDDDNAESAFLLMKQMVIDQQGAMIIVTHDMSLAKQMDRVLFLQQGVLVERN